MGKLAVKKTMTKKRPRKSVATKRRTVADGTVQPSAKALRIMLRLAKENRIPQSWIDCEVDPTVAE